MKFESLTLVTKNFRITNFDNIHSCNTARLANIKVKILMLFINICKKNYTSSDHLFILFKRGNNEKRKQCKVIPDIKEI